MAEPNEADRAAQAALTLRLADAGFAPPGTLLEVAHVCGKPNCRCTADPPRPHGPYHRWTRRIDGKTVTRHLTAPQAGALRGAARERDEHQSPRRRARGALALRRRTRPGLAAEITLKGSRALRNVGFCGTLVQ